MDSPQKLAFVIQSNQLQGLIWQALLKSQSIAVILEPSRADLVDCISQISAAGLTLPDVILLDTEISDLNPYEFCRWSRQHFPQIKVFLTRFHRGSIADTERRWAIQQGAVGFLGGFHRDTLMSTAAESIRLILAALDYSFLNEKTLLSVLLNVRRHMGTTAPPPLTSLAAPPAAAGRGQGALPASNSALTGLAGSRYANGNGLKGNGTNGTGTNGNGTNGNGTNGTDRQTNGLPGKGSQGGATNLATQAPGPKADSPDVLNDISWVASGLRALNQHPDHGTPLAAESLFTSEPPSPPPPVKSSEIPKISADVKAEETPTQVRRYRGVVY